MEYDKIDELLIAATFALQALDESQPNNGHKIFHKRTRERLWEAIKQYHIYENNKQKP